MIELVEGDITTLAVDAVVNAANESLLGGGGVDGAIHRAAGPELLEECRGLGGCATGQAKATKGYGLPAKWVIHTVGPVWRGGSKNEEGLLANCYRNSLALARDVKAETLAFPGISTGAYGFPVEKAAPIAINECRKWLATNMLPRRLILVCFNPSDFGVYRRLLDDSGEHSQLRLGEAGQWARREASGIRIGITNGAQKELGSITHIELPTKGEELKTGDRLAVIESVKTAIDLPTPVAGRVSGVNTLLKDRPELINEDAYGSGWFCEMADVELAEWLNLSAEGGVDDMDSDTESGSAAS